MTLNAMATACWDQIKDQLEDRSVLDLGMVDDETVGELDKEQIDEIAARFEKLYAIVEPAKALIENISNRGVHDNWKGLAKALSDLDGL